MGKMISVWLSSESGDITRDEIAKCFRETMSDDDGSEAVLIVPYADASLSFEDILIKNGVVASWRAAGASIWEYIRMDGRGYIFINRNGGVKLTRIRV